MILKPTGVSSNQQCFVESTCDKYKMKCLDIKQTEMKVTVVR